MTFYTQNDIFHSNGQNDWNGDLQCNSAHLLWAQYFPGRCRFQDLQDGTGCLGRCLSVQKPLWDCQDMLGCARTCQDVPGHASDCESHQGNPGTQGPYWPRTVTSHPRAQEEGWRLFQLPRKLLERALSLVPLRGSEMDISPWTVLDWKYWKITIWTILEHFVHLFYFAYIFLWICK